MQLKEAIEQIWKNKKYAAGSETEAVSHLNEEVAESLKALLRGDREKALDELGDAMSCLFIALKVMEVDPDKVIKDQINKMKESPKRTMHVFSDRVEIRVGQEVKGGWQIWSADDLNEAKKMAKEFKCKIIWEEATQLSLINEKSETATE